MAKTRIGLDVGSTAVRIAEVTEGDRPSVLRLGQVPLPLGAVEAGEIRRGEQVTAGIERLLEVSSIDGDEVYLGVESTRVVVREIALPWLPEKELREALSFQVQDYIPMAPEEAVLDLELLDEAVVDGQRMQKILLVAASRGAVNAQIEAVEAAGLVPVAVDLAPFAAVRATASTDSTDAEALVDIGGHITSISLHVGGHVRLVRIVSVGGRNITSTIARNLGIEEGAAELLKRGDADPTGAEGLDRSKARQAALDGARPLIEDLASTLEFSMSQEADLDVKRIVLTGGASHLDGLTDLLDQRIHLPVTRAKVFGRARSRLAPELGAMVEAGGSFSVAIGLALAEPETGRGGRRS
ncbi:MAG: type IV pilus assembly protein PilM [Actinomycetota bacterium]